MIHRITLLLEYTKLSEVAAEKEEMTDRMDAGNAKPKELPEKKTEKGRTTVTQAKSSELTER